MAQTVKRLPTMWETRFQSLGGEDALEKEMATHSSILAWKIPWTGEPGRLQSMGSQRVGHVGKTTRPFRYDLNQIPYDYTVEVRNRFKGLDLIDRVHEELWTEVRDIVQEAGIKTTPKKKKCKKAKWLS